MLQSYEGSCHCGAVRFAAELDLSQTSYRCNCSSCRRKRFWSVVAKEDQFRLLSGEGMLTEYAFGAKRFQHFFCNVCGVQLFDVDNREPAAKTYGVNIGCLEGVSEEELSRMPITYVDGMNDAWHETPRYYSHL